MQFTILTTVALAFLPAALAAPTARAPEPWRVIHANGDNTKCLDVQGANFENGTPVQIYDCDPTADSQLWQINSDTSGPIQLAAPNSNLTTTFCLDAGSQPFQEHAQAHIWECHAEGDANRVQQTWYYNTQGGDDHISIVDQNPGWCLKFDDTNVNHDTFTGGYVGISGCDGSNGNQKWTL